MQERECKTIFIFTSMKRLALKISAKQLCILNGIPLGFVEVKKPNNENAKAKIAG